MKFPSTPIIDTFNRADAADLGAAWLPQYYGGGSSLAIISNTARQLAGNGSSYTVATYGPDVEAYAKMATFGGGELWISLLASDAGTATYDGYELRVAPTTWSLYRTLNGTTTSIAGGSLTNIAGEQFGIRRLGTCVQFWKQTVGGSWTLISNVIDATYDVTTWQLSIFLSSSLSSIDEFGGGNCVPVPFPSTAVFDTFNRANGDLVRTERWPQGGDPTDGNVLVVSNQMGLGARYQTTGFPWDRPFCGSNAETYIDIADGWNEGPFADISLVLNQNNSYSWLGYEVYTSTDEAFYIEQRNGASPKTTLLTGALLENGANGDKFGVRRTNDGCVEFWHYITALGAWRITAEAWDTTHNGPFYLSYYIDGATGNIQRFDNAGGGTMPDGRAPLTVLASRRR